MQVNCEIESNLVSCNHLKQQHINNKHNNDNYTTSEEFHYF